MKLRSGTSSFASVIAGYVFAFTASAIHPAWADNQPGSGQQNPQQQLGSLGFALGIGNTFLSKENINSAEVDSGLVRITDSSKQQRAFWLESHYVPRAFNFGNCCSTGPFVAAQFSSNNNLFNAIGVGWVVALKHTPLTDFANNTSLNIGIGWASSQIQTLADGYLANQAPPAGDTSVRFKKINSNGIMLMFSFGFYSITGTTQNPVGLH